MAKSKGPRVGDVRRRQRKQALALANRRRARRSELRRKLREGEVDASALVAGQLEEWEADVANYRIEQLLYILPGVGSVNQWEILNTFMASPRAKVSSLSYERREELAKLVRQATGEEKF